MIARQRLFVSTLTLLWGMTASISALAQRAEFAIPDPDPEIERKSFVVAEGFEVNLFAADPSLAKPIQMNFDPQGRLWVVSSEVYPQIKPGQVANDKVLILEDRDGDGRADRTSVFAEGLLIPTGVEPGDGGAYVANSTELLHFQDQDGDGKADRKRVVLSGFGTEDTHHILHTLRWGPDGSLHFNQSIYIHSHIETPHGVKRLGGGGIWRFRPRSLELDVFIRGLVNPWGHHFDRWGQSFATDGAGGEGINYCLPGAYYVTAPDAVRILAGLNPGSPKYCGEEFVSGAHLPPAWSGSILTNDFRGNRVCRFVLSEDGAGYSSREQPELIKTPHVAFRPIDVKMGPDGAIYIADWYNPIIQHGEVDFRDPRRDHTRGRIWRVTAKNRPLVPRPKLVGASTETLLEALKASEDWTRHNARRVLTERGREILPKLKDWVASISKEDPNAETLKLEGLWVYQSLDEIEPELLRSLLNSPDHRVRAAAVRTAGHWRLHLDDALKLIGKSVADPHPRVRLEAVRALALFPSKEAAEAAMAGLDHPVDRFLDYALWLTARDLAPHWLPEVQAGRLDFQGKPERLIFALLAVDSPEVVKPLTALLKAGRVPSELTSKVLSTIAARGEPTDLELVFQLAIQPMASDRVNRPLLLDTLVRATRERKVRPTGDLTKVQLLLMADNATRAAAARAAGAWKLDSLRASLVSIVSSKGGPESVQRAATDALAEMGGEASRADLKRLASPDSPGATRRLAIGALASVEPETAARLAVDRFAESSRPGEVESLMARFLELQNGSKALAQALKGKSIPADVAKLALRRVQASGRPEEALTQALSASGQLANLPKGISPGELKQLVEEVAKHGSAQRGEQIFRRKELSCLKCHAIAGAGGQVGPGLESVGASAPLDYLIESLMNPSKAIKENYHALVVATEDGKIVTGIKLRQTESNLILRDAEDQEISLPLGSIEDQKPAGSLMPENLTESLTRSEFLDLVRFLSELGKIGPYSISKERVARRWRVLEPTKDEADRISRNGLDATLETKGLTTWAPAYSLVSGVLPLSALKPTRTYQGMIGLASTQVDVTTAGPVKLRLNSIDGLKLWVDDQRIETQTDLTLDLKPGVHTLTISVDMARRKDNLLCTLEDLPNSPARAAMVVGK